MRIPRTTYRIQFHKDFNFRQLEGIAGYLEKLGVDTLYASPIFRAVRGSAHGYDGTDTNAINPEIGTLEKLRKLSELLRGQGIGWLQDFVPNHMAFHPDNAWLMDLLRKGEESKYRDHFDTTLAGDWFRKCKLMVPFLGTDMDFGLPPSGEAYELCDWRETERRINYRRFFTVNGLICMNVQDKGVFRDVHRLVAELLASGVIDGLRIDHIDGLYRPTKYLMDLRNMCGEDTYIVAEKILERGERLPKGWPIQGTTGYDFLGLCNQLATDGQNELALTAYYERLLGRRVSIRELELEKKDVILRTQMQGEVDNLVHLLKKLNLLDDRLLSRVELTSGIRALLTYFPVYRLYEEKFPLSDKGYKLICSVFDEAKDRGSAGDGLCALKDMIDRAQFGRDKAYRKRAIRFLLRCMQFTGPVMAKGVEDTLMYNYHRLLAHNEVGDHPSGFGLSKKEFHKAMLRRRRDEPMALNATATHDTKRGEDARARLLTLAAWPEGWMVTVDRWQAIVAEHYEGELPHVNDRYLMYQALVGGHPMPGVGADGRLDVDGHMTVDLKGFGERFKAYLVKALREGKERSDWGEPDVAYEERVGDFAEFLLDREAAFYPAFLRYFEQLVDFGIVNSLTQLILKFTCPGVPDVYQGTELWDLSFVDPDNRQAVDYGLRQQYLREIEMDADEAGELGASGETGTTGASDRLSRLWKERYNGKIKLFLLKQLAALRKANPRLFTHGEYRPLKVKGRYHRYLLAFERRRGTERLVVVVPLYLMGIEGMRDGVFADGDFAAFNWADTRVVLGDGQSVQRVEILVEAPTKERFSEKYPRADSNQATGQKSDLGSELKVNEIFGVLPLALIRYEEVPRKRSAGILMHISSLPSPFGIGDLGKPAHRFAERLWKSGQRWWQVLPLGPTGAEQHDSPYNTWSAMAGNPLLISLEGLADMGLLKQRELKKGKTALGSISAGAWDAADNGKKKRERREVNSFVERVDYRSVEAVKWDLLERAFERFYKRVAGGTMDTFAKFCRAQSAWLDDYALFMALRRKNLNLPWYEWPESFQSREPSALTAFASLHEREITKEKWLQYIFFRQWHELVEHCHDLNILIMGDVPIYVGHDSADVWAHRHLFAVKEDGSMKAVAGVPPDYFNADGQLWNMPVFDWKAMKKEKYAWWINRLAHNQKLFDKVRLDHFRGFSAYWEVPAKETTAKNGEWKKGPGADLFEHVKRELGELPFVAEDLGDIDEPVYELRDRYALPGMKVLQFAFGEDMPLSNNIPHNYTRNFVVYTGTHDNNTLLGWFTEELDEEARMRLSGYTGTLVREENINDVMIRLAYASVANLCMVPMQDVLKLGSEYRMNSPASVGMNWKWRMLRDAFGKKEQKGLKNFVRLYNR